MWSSLDCNNNPGNYTPGMNWSGFNYMNKEEWNSKQLLDTMSANAISLFVNTSPNSSTASEFSPPIRKKKKPCPVPAEKKDDAYVQRRQKNNLSAQKSREERRRREQEKDTRIKELETQCAYLCHQNTLLQAELAKMRMVQQYNSMQSTNSTMNSSMNSTGASVAPFVDPSWS
uniref:BZIP domain-containing protein n=2 Tax=Bursaphelenchus xylophilus TaxID=6326 RepID=A0A1I7SUM5_BURXY